MKTRTFERKGRLMKKMNLKKIIGTLAALLLTASLLVPYKAVFSVPAGSARFYGTDVTLNIGDSYAIVWMISANENVLLEATFAVPDGLTVTGPIQCGQAINGGTSNNKVLDYSGNFASFNGTITIRADRAGEFRVQMTEVTMISAADSSVQTVASSVFTVYVRTKEQTDASIAEQERIRREQAERASREQAEAASRAASISASASEEERRRKEQEDAEYREWLSRSEAEASASASESEREASISASESEREASISASESEVEASISASESEVERTRPTEVKDLEYVRYAFGADEDEDGEGDRVFYFVTPDGELLWPENTKPISMRLNDVNVLALRTDTMSSNTYLVYGMKELSDVPAWFYWHRSTNEFFRYDYLNRNTSFSEPETTEPNGTEGETTKAPATAAQKTNEPPTGTTLPARDGEKKMSVKDVLILTLSGALGGAALTALIFLLVLRARKKEEEPETSEDAAKENAPAESAVPEGPREKTGDTDAVDLD